MENLFIRTNNKKNFLIGEIKEFHPKSVKYIQYWQSIKKRCIEGLWSIDDAKVKIDLDKSDREIQELKSDKWRWMTPNCFFYANLGTILHQPEDAPKSAPKKKIRPDLRDIDWEFFYNWMEARGFSGFDGDDENSCNRDLINFQSETGVVINFHKSCYTKDGKLKNYVPARDYLRSYYPRPMGQAMYENDAKDLLIFGSRGTGKSFWVAVGVIQWGLLFDEAKRYDEESRNNPYKVEICVGASIASKSSDLMAKVYESMINLPGEWGKGTKEYEPSPVSKRMAGVIKPNNGKDKYRHEYMEKSGNEWFPKGSGSNVNHVVYTMENPEAAAGGRYTYSIVEEVGLAENILTIHGSNDATLKEGTTKFGSALYLGTGGNVEKVQETSVLFYDPAGFGFLEFDDVWEGGGKIGWFIPVEYALNQFKDKNGNTDYAAAKLKKDKDRAEKRKSKSSKALDLEMMNYPMVPSEMFLNAKGNRFPMADLKHHLAEVKSKPQLFENAHYFGELIFKEGILEWKNTDSRELVKKWPIIDNSMHPGVIEIFEMPKKDAGGRVFQNRYIQGTDTYDDDESTTNSLGSTFIFDLWTNRIVAEFTGRRLTNEFYEICRKLNIFYSAKHCYENNKKGLFGYYLQKNSTHLLADTPESLRDVADYTISKIGNKAKGVHMTTPIIQYGLRLIENWLLEPAYSADGELNPEILNLHRIRSQGLLTELIHYKPDGNFDRISALIQVMILKEDLFKITEQRKTKKVVDLAKDPFFDRFKLNPKQPFSILTDSNSYERPKNI